jgi:multiple sugar transport system permease protein
MNICSISSAAFMEIRPRIKAAWHRHNVSGYAFILPALLVILCLVAYPFAMAIYLSMSDAWVGTEGKFVGFRNYGDLVQNDIFRQTLQNSLVFTFFAVTVKTILGMALALLLNARIRFQRIFRGAILLPWVIPNTMSTLGWLWMFDPLFSVLNWVLKHAGLIQTNVSWLSNPYWAMVSIVTVNVWRGLPFFAITLLAGLVSIPPELYRAAHIDGAGAVRCFFRITLPLLKPLLLIVILFSTISTISDFNIVYILTRGGPMNLTHLLATLSFQIGLSGGRLGLGAAVSLFMFPVLCVVVYFQLKTIRGGATYD